jgi:hypothetical protein
MATLRSAELTAAAIAALKANGALTTALGGQKVYSNVPEGTSAPYILMGGTEETPWAEIFDNTGDDGARECTLWFEAVSTFQGLDEVESLTALAVAVLTTPASWSSVPRFSVAEFFQAQQPLTVELDGVIYLTRPCAVKVFLT